MWTGWIPPLCFALGALGVSGCNDQKCGVWEAQQDVDPRLHTLTYQIAVGLDGTLAEFFGVEDEFFQARESGTTEDLLGVWGDRARLFGPLLAVGRHGTVRVSQGPGEPWEGPILDDLVEADLRGVAYYPDFALVVGDAGTVLVGTSLGTRWRRVNPPTTLRLNAVAIDGEGHAVVVGDQGTILRTADQGASWEVVASPSPEDLLSLLILSSNDAPYAFQSGYIVGAAGTLLHSTEGATWKDVATGVTEDLRQITAHTEAEFGPYVPLILGDTRLFTWTEGEPQLRIKAEFRRPILSVGPYLSNIVVLGEQGELLQFTEPYVCALPKN